MVRSSTMGSWAFASLSQPPPGSLLAGIKGKEPSGLTFHPESYLYSIRRCEGGDPNPPEPFLNQIRVLTPVCR